MGLATNQQPSKPMQHWSANDLSKVNTLYKHQICKGSFMSGFSYWPISSLFSQWLTYHRTQREVVNRSKCDNLTVIRFLVMTPFHSSSKPTNRINWKFKLREGFGTQISIWLSCLVVEQLAANHYLPKPRGVWAQMNSVKLTHFTIIKYVREVFGLG